VDWMPVVGQATDPGLVRARNEDYVGAFAPADLGSPADRGHLFLVADGMGGLEAGDLASRLAGESLREFYYSPDAPPEPGEALRSGVCFANRRVYETARRASRRGMGTTLTALVVRDASAYLAHVGDSRAYLVGGGRIRQLTADHSRVAVLVERGVISESDAENHPDAHIVLRALGVGSRVDVDVVGPLRLRPRDRLVLCTDGLSRLVKPEEIRRLSEDYPAQEACERLVACARARGGFDNITVQIVRARAPERRPGLTARAGQAVRSWLRNP
jgi:serine/threonine protein phosphatase PrpC